MNKNPSTRSVRSGATPWEARASSTPIGTQVDGTLLSAGSPKCRISEETSHGRGARHDDGRHPRSTRAAARETPTESDSARPAGPTCQAEELVRPHPRRSPRLRYPARPPLPDPRLRRIGTSGAGASSQGSLRPSRSPSSSRWGCAQAGSASPSPISRQGPTPSPAPSWTAR